MTTACKQTLKYLLEIFSVFVLLGLSAFCFELYANQQKVLGAKTESENTLLLEEQTYWEELLNKNPDYLPGWLEIGRLDKVYEINPNFSELHP